MDNWELAHRIVSELNVNGAGLGNASIYIVMNVLDNQSSGLTPRALDAACTCAKNPIIKPVNGVCPVCEGTPRQ